MAGAWEVIKQTVHNSEFGDSYPDYLRVRFDKEPGQDTLRYALYASNSDGSPLSFSRFWVDWYDFTNYRYAFYIVEREAQTKRILESMPPDGDFLYTTLTPPIPTKTGATVVVARQRKNQNPVLSISTGNMALSQGTVTLSGTVNDPDGDTVTISATIAGIPKQTTVAGSSGWTLSWPVSDLPQAQYSNIIVTANDGQGGTATATYTGIITIDKTNPSIAISGVSQGQTYTSVTPVFSATDTGGAGLQSCTATLNGNAFTSGTTITTAGNYTLVVTAKDNAGNVSTQTVSFFVNSNPTMTVTTADNQSLTDGKSFSITGNATDANSGDVLTVKYKIDNGTVRNIASGVASGTPLSFTKNLTFSNKRLRDGATEVTGDLAENVDHILTVWAEDDKGGKSTEVTCKFRVIHNRPPIISGTNEDLGTIQAPPSKTYTVSDAENDTFTVTEKIDGKVIRSFAGVAGQENTITIPHDFWIRLQPGIQHKLVIEATDSKGMTAARTYTFVRQETKLEFKLKKPFVTDIAAKRILVTIDAVVPNGTTMKIEACNNAFDASPTWEDITNHVRFNRGFLFTNTEKTAEQWGVDIRFMFEKGTANSQVIVNGFGGAFD
ncbi:Ig-like domain-containing protein [Aneurinibacillus migulanus]|uniref:Ig-like domain-containing protein n=1 Tax=Aneurinibacillus migulanus TaxID=47500 RepID=UPI00209D06D0|nr:Ig-like domain-containing protein [Aneurinibacillus migulanus]MCP1357505.1 Ig-like domain-containing protein [Aneurinibacillus migulanus]